MISLSFTKALCLMGEAYYLFEIENLKSKIVSF